jgi:bifunctional non-homologous end joining protein LigD
MRKDVRKGKVFLDFFRNQRGATSVAAYSTRALPGAPVATPLRWDELSRGRGAGAYTLANLASRLTRLKGDPWEGFFELKQTLTAAMLKEAA